MRSQGDIVLGEGNLAELKRAILYAIAENKRLSGMSILDVPLRNRFSYFASIYTRDDQSRCDVGSEAILRFHMWTFSYLRRMNQTHLASVSKTAEWVIEHVAFTFFKRGFSVTDPTVNKLIAKLANHLSKDISTFRFVLPCLICAQSDCTTFEIGGVRFRQTHLIKDELASGTLDLGTPWSDRATEYFSKFEWVADVEIEAVDKEAASHRSTTAIHLALAVLKLFYGGHTEARIRLGTLPNRDTELASLWFQDGKAHLSWESRSNTAPLPSDWHSDLRVGANGYRLEFFDAVLIATYRPSTQNFLKNKCANALKWFADATIDTFAASRVNKFVNVLEALTSCGERQGLTESVSSRVASMLAGWPEEGSYDSIVSKVRRIYDVRSELVHGRLDPLALELGMVADQAGHLAHMAIISFADFLLHLGYDREDYDNGKLANDFAIVHANVQRLQAAS